MMDENLPPTFLLRRHPRAPKWKGAFYNPLKCTPEERRFTVVRGNGSPVGDLEFSGFKSKEGLASTPWGEARITSKSILGTRYEVTLGGAPVAILVYSMSRSKLRIELSAGQTLSFARTKLLWRMEAETDYGRAILSLDGTIAPTGEKVWELDRKASKELKKQTMTERPEQVGGLRRPKDPAIRYGSIEEPFYIQWSIHIPNALESNQHLIASIAILLSFKFLQVEAPQS